MLVLSDSENDHFHTERCGNYSRPVWGVGRCVYLGKGFLVVTSNQMAHRFHAFFCGCAASVSSSSLKSYPPKLKDQNIDVYGLYDNVPQENEVIGTVEYDDTGFSIFCGYSDMLKSFINETREMGEML